MPPRRGGGRRYVACGTATLLVLIAVTLMRTPWPIIRRSSLDERTLKGLKAREAQVKEQTALLAQHCRAMGGVYDAVKGCTGLPTSSVEGCPPPPVGVRDGEDVGVDINAEGCVTGSENVPDTRLTRALSTAIMPHDKLRDYTKALCVNHYEPTRVQPGALTLFSFRYLPVCFISDLKGHIMGAIRFEWLTVLVSPKFVNSTTIAAILKTYGSRPSGWVRRTRPYLYNWETGQSVVVPFKPTGALHHDIDFSTKSNTFLALHRWVSPAHGGVLFDDIFEIGLDGEVVWHWNGSQVLPFIPENWSPKDKHPTSDCVDFSVPYCKDHMHGNTLFWDRDNNLIYYNAKHTDSFFKISYPSGKILWAVGRYSPQYGGFKLHDINGKEVGWRDLFYKVHGVERVGPAAPPGGGVEKFVFFDNVYKNATMDEIDGHHEHRSRVLELEVDEVRRVVRTTWHWVGPTGLWASQMADADPLPNGNFFSSFTSVGSLVESTRDGDVVWRMNLPRLEDVELLSGKRSDYWVYHAERFLARPQVTVNPTAAGAGFPSFDAVRKVDGGATVNVTFTTYNTVRVRMRVGGVVRVEDEHETVLASRPFNFEAAWNPTLVSLVVECGSLRCGTAHRLMIIVTNEDEITSQPAPFMVTVPCGDEKNGDAKPID